MREGIIAIQCGAFHLGVAGRKYFNTTPLGRAVTTTAIVRAMREDGVDVFGDGSTHKGNDIQRFYRYGVLDQPGAARSTSRGWTTRSSTAFGGRTEMSEYLERHRPAVPDGRREGLQHRRQLLGATHEAKDLERLDKGMRIVNPIMGVAFWKPEVTIEPEEVTVALRAGPAGQRSTASASRRASSCSSTCNVVGGRHGLGMSDQIENRVIDAKSRGIYEAPGMALLHIVLRAPAVARSTTRTRPISTSTLGRRLGRLLYEGKWFDPEAMMLKDALTRWVAPSITGQVTLELRRGDDYTIVVDRGASTWRTTRTSCRWRRSRACFTPEDRIGALEMQNLSVLDNRAFLIHHLDATRALGAGAGGGPRRAS